MDPDKRYGIWWYNRRRATKKMTSGVGENGHREYKRRQNITYKPREEWIVVPVPDAGLPRERVDTARKAIEGNCRISSAGRRFWELPVEPSTAVSVVGGCAHTLSLPEGVANGATPITSVPERWCTARIPAHREVCVPKS